MQEFDYLRLIYLLVLAIAISGLVYTQFKERLGYAIKATLTWVMIFFATIAVYGLWDDVRNAIVPTYITTHSEDRISLQRQADGHFYAKLNVDGKDIKFLIDTGASEIVLSKNDAEAAGIDFRRLRYSGRASTANGIVSTAPIRIEKLRFGNLVNRRIIAYVTAGDLDISLLGQSYLEQFDKVIIDGDIMTLQIN